MNLWQTNSKNAAICAACGHCGDRSSCLISADLGRRSRVTYVFDYPSKTEASRGASGVGREGVFLKQITKEGVDAMLASAVDQGVSVDVEPHDAHSTLFLTGYARGKGRAARTALDSCAGYWRPKLDQMQQQLDMTYPGRGTPILVTFGAVATSAMYKSNAKFRDLQGKFHETTIGGRAYLVYPMKTLRQLMGEPGLVALYAADMAKVYRHAYGVPEFKPLDLDALMKMYRIPASDAELIELTDEIIAYTGNPAKYKPEEWALSIDSETTGLDAYADDFRVLMISVAWGTGLSTAICLDDPRMTYSREVAHECITRILSCEKPKVLHNIKYDYGALALASYYGFEIRNITYDTMLGAHYLDESASGNFGLDALVRHYAPEFTGYKGMVQDALKSKVQAALIASVGHSEPDMAKSFHIVEFYPDVDYAPAVYSEELRERMLSEDVSALWDAELLYVQSCLDPAQAPAKKRARSKVRKILKGYDEAYPATAKPRNYASELEAHGYAAIPLNVLQVYAAIDTDVTRRIWVKQNKRAHYETRGEDAPQGCRPQLLSVMETLYVPASFSLSEAEFTGTRIDTDLLDTYAEEITAERDKHQEALRTMLVDDSFNPASSTDVSRILEEVYVVKKEDRVYGDTGLSVRKEWLYDMIIKYDDLARSSGDAKGSPGYAHRRLANFLYHLARYRATDKAVGTFLKGIRRRLDPRDYLHTQYNLNGTRTGRLSSSKPNLQNVPFIIARFSSKCDAYPSHEGWNLKRLFLPDPGEVFWQMDISAAEIRVLCAYAQDEELIQALKDGLDIHSFTASQVFDIPYKTFIELKDTDPDIKLKRTATKRVVFGTLYGAGAEKLAEQIFGTLSPLRAERAQQIAFADQTRMKLFERFPAVDESIRATKIEAMRDSYVETYFGRRRRFALGHATRRDTSAAKREAVNFKIQSTASDLVLAQLIEVSKHIKELGGKLQLTVHDSMCGSIPAHNVPKLTEFFDKYIVNMVQERFDWLPVPFAYDLEVGVSYGDPVDIGIIMQTEDEIMNSVEEGNAASAKSAKKRINKRRNFLSAFPKADPTHSTQRA